MGLIELFTNPPEVIIGKTTTLAEGFLAVVGFVVAVLSALVLHEVAHGYIAYRNGDNTAKNMGRLTLNPIKHLDPVGTVLMLFVGFGWAKPVPVNPMNFKKYKVGMFSVAVAGVIMNLILSFILTGICSLVIFLAEGNLNYVVENPVIYYIFYFLFIFLQYGSILNICLCLFNILPIFPLDGFRVLETFLPPSNKFMMFMRRYSYFVLLGLIVLGYFADRVGMPYLDIIGLYINSLSGIILRLFEGFWGLIFG